MRKELGRLNGERKTFVGTFERFGTKSGWRGDEPTVLLTSIRNGTGQPICDHLWFALTKGFESLDLQPGDVVQFDARVKEYVKGYFGWREDVFKPAEVDYKLSHPTKARKLMVGTTVG